MQNADKQQPAPSNDQMVEAAFAALEKSTDYLSVKEKASLRSAFCFAKKAHHGQTRSSGEPYITHPISVAIICASWKLDVQTLMAALLHDSIEDCNVTQDEIAAHFDPVTAAIVDGVTKLDKILFNTREEGQAESFRKMLLATAHDVRVILLKLADRTHNMNTLAGLRPEKQKRIGQETMEIYAPIAYRLGMNKLYRELQALSFKSIMPWRANTLEKALNQTNVARSGSIERICLEITEAFESHNLPLKLELRTQNPYSIYVKMEQHQQSFAQVTDHLNFKIIVQSVEKCYEAMGILHQRYKPLTSQFKDHIALPKFNGYQSLHTTVIGPANANIGFQIRTDEMDHIAEYGILARWLYKDENENSRDEVEVWMQSLLEIQNDTHNAGEFMDDVKVDLSSDEIYVLSPMSKIVTLPQGSTTVDFAYAIHSDVGDHCIAAQVNGEQVPLSTVLNNGDIVEIITAPVAKPNPTWLTFVRTGRARSKIRGHLKTLALAASVSLGKKILTHSLNTEGITSLPEYNTENQQLWEKLLRITGNISREELLSDISFGKRVPELIVGQMLPLLQEKGIKPDVVLLSKGRYMSQEEKLANRSALLLDGTEESSVQYAQCCYPIPGDSIVGYLGQGESLSIHVSDCAVAAQLRQKDPERWLKVDWADEVHRTYESNVWITVSTRKGMLVSIVNDLQKINTDIIFINMADGPLDAPDTFRCIVTVKDRIHLANIIKTLRRNPFVLKAGRVKPSIKKK